MLQCLSRSGGGRRGVSDCWLPLKRRAERMTAAKVGFDACDKENHIGARTVWPGRSKVWPKRSTSAMPPTATKALTGVSREESVCGRVLEAEEVRRCGGHRFRRVDSWVLERVRLEQSNPRRSCRKAASHKTPLSCKNQLYARRGARWISLSVANQDGSSVGC